MVKQECIPLFPEVETVTRKMTDEQFGILIRAVIAYRLRGEVYTGDDIAVDIAFQFLSNQQDRVEAAKAAKSKAAKERWAKQTEEEPVQNDAEPMQNDAEPMQNDAEPMQNDAEPMQSDADLMHKCADLVPQCAEGMQNDAPILSNPIQSVPIQSNPIQSNPIQSSPILSKERVAAKPPTPAQRERKVYGKFGWVKLSAEEYDCLRKEMGQTELDRCIAYLDESAQSTGNRNGWWDWSAVLRKCHKQGWGLGGSGGDKKPPIPTGASIA